MKFSLGVILVLPLLRMIGKRLQRGSAASAHWGHALGIAAHVGWVITVFIMVWIWQRYRCSKSWLRELRCPQCKADLAYLVTNRDYADPDANGIPERISVCPFCALPFDEDYEAQAENNT